MAINQDFPSLDGIEPSWADIAITSVTSGNQLLPMKAIAGIKTSRKVEVGERRGASGGRVTGRTTGQGSQDSSMTLYRSGLRSFVRALAKEAPVRGVQRVLSLVFFDINIQHSVPGDDEIYQKIIRGCRYTGEDDDMKEGFEADKLEITLNPIEIVQIIDGNEIVLL